MRITVYFPNCIKFPTTFSMYHKCTCYAISFWKAALQKPHWKESSRGAQRRPHSAGFTCTIMCFTLAKFPSIESCTRSATPWASRREPSPSARISMST